MTQTTASWLYLRTAGNKQVWGQEASAVITMFPFFFFFFKKGKPWGFPSSPEVKTYFSLQCWGGGPYSIPGHETRIPHALWPKKANAKYYG